MSEHSVSNDAAGMRAWPERPGPTGQERES